MHEDEYYYLFNDIPEPNIGKCKRCVNKHNCGNKNKREASWCEKYRPEIKKKKGNKRK